MEVRRLLPIFMVTLSVALGFSPHVATAAPIAFFADLAGFLEEPPNQSPGTGLAEVTIDPTEHTMDVSAAFSNLVAPTTVAHIHVINGPGDPDTTDTVGPVATTTPTFPGFPAGVTAGTYDQLFNTLDAATYNPSFVTASGSLAQAEAELFAAIIEGRAYFNIHSTTFTAGEIRGFLTPVSEPATLALLSLTAGGALALAAVRRRRVA